MDRLTRYVNDIEKYDYAELAGGISQAVCNKLGKLEDLEEQLGCTLEELFNGLMTKQASLRYFDKYDAKNNHCEVGWYVNMIMYGWVTLQDFINGLKGKSE